MKAVRNTLYSVNVYELYMKRTTQKKITGVVKIIYTAGGGADLTIR